MENTNPQKIFEYSHYFENMQFIQEIDHIIDEFFGYLVENVPDYDFSGIAVIENRMAVSFGAFDILYPPSKKIVLKSQNLSDKEFTDKIEEINLASRIVLCLNGEMYSALNRRIRMLQLDLIKNIEEEMHFVELVCFKFKKAGIMWTYRQKLADKYFEQKGVSKQVVEAFLEKEDPILEEFFKKYPRNYYGWGYKKYLIDEFVVKHGYIDTLFTQYFKVREYCEKHIHDYCAFHLLGALASKLDNLGDTKNQIKQEEILWAQNLLQKYQDLYILESLEVHDKGIKYSELGAIKKFLHLLQKS